MTPANGKSMPLGRAHVAEIRRQLDALERDVDEIDAWGRRMAAALVAGGRLLAVGNGGSAAHAQHLTSELVGRYRDERRPLSAIALHADASSVTAIVNDYGADELFARQVRAHGRPGDVVVAFSTSGHSPNVLAAVDAAHDAGLLTYALTGPTPNPLAELAHHALSVSSRHTATVQEVHQIVVHLLCAAIDVTVASEVAALAAVPR